MTTEEMSTRIKGFDEMSPERQEILLFLLDNIQNGRSKWRQGWEAPGAPISLVTGKRYQGQNNLYLTAITSKYGYNDNRWITFKEMNDRGYKFKRDEKGEVLAKGRGVYVEFYYVNDLRTKKPFDHLTVEGLTTEEKNEYYKQYVRTVRKRYIVFNCSLVEGVEKYEISKFSRNSELDDIISYWSEKEAKIEFKGDMAYYNSDRDIIIIPPKEHFLSQHEFYSTIFHEIAHSTGAKHRLARDMATIVGTEGYATEELRAEIASIFLESLTGIKGERKALENNGAYVRFWLNTLENNPEILFGIISDAQKICNYVESKYLSYKVEIEDKTRDTYRLVSIEEAKIREEKFLDIGDEVFKYALSPEGVKAYTALSKKQSFKNAFNSASEDRVIKEIEKITGENTKLTLEIFKNSKAYNEKILDKEYLKKISDIYLDVYIKVKGGYEK